MSLGPRTSVKILVSVLALGTFSCGSDEVKYEPRQPPKVQVSLPAVPNVPQTPIKKGDSYTVWGAGYSLRSRVLRKSLGDKPISVEGYIVDTNLMQAPECAVHKGGKADPENCRPPFPTFWIGDTKEATKADSIAVIGWASNYAQIFDAIEEYDKKGEKAEVQDTFWGKPLPNPLPAKGAKVRVTGSYSTTFTGGSTGAQADPIMGILTYQKWEILEQSSELATLPGVKRKPKDQPKG
jgi:hypothetical protein